MENKNAPNYWRLTPRFLMQSWVLLLICVNASSATLPQFDQNKHLGPASCASSVCHGKAKAVLNSNVMLNEYRTWVTEDEHAKAYQTLLSDESKVIAQKLGLASAHTAKICLDCHADNVAVEKRGPKFQLRDGVGCEACHGGSELWIESHTEKTVTHKDNLTKNMYPTENGSERAKLCLSCHYGNTNKLTTHRIMGAGHPRLSFEMETFTANQPAHYKIDADYIERKGKFIGFKMWLTGQIETAQANLKLLQEYVVNKPSVVPELYFYDCHSCHHAMADKRWTVVSQSGYPDPGTLRLNLVNLTMLSITLNQIVPQKHLVFHNGIKSLQMNSQKNYVEFATALAQLQTLLNEVEKEFMSGNYDDTQIKSVRASILDQAAQGKFTDYIEAEQAFLAIENITISLKQFDARESELNSLYDTLSNEDTFKANQFKSIAQKVAHAFN